MRRIGVRGLKSEASDVIRAVREERAEYVVTFRGRPVAVIVPLDEGDELPTREAMRAARQRSRAFMARWDAAVARLGDAIGDEIGGQGSAAEWVAEQRRSL